MGTKRAQWGGAGGGAQGQGHWDLWYQLSAAQI